MNRQSNSRWGAGALALVVLVGSGLSGCECGALPLDESDGSVGGGGGSGGFGGGTGGGFSGDGDGGYDGGLLPDGGCPPFACQGRCGPIRDFCRGEVVQCGGCGTELVCNLANNTCGQPQISCGDLGAVCGTIRNSCGWSQNCGACPTGQECDRNTNKCVACSPVTPADLGYQCGMVYLGCGPASTRVDAGTCPNGLTCNNLNHVCEPPCSAETDQILCASASAECGTISNGCGGKVDSCGACNADAGFSCGNRGIANRCDLPEVPNECVAANRNCGKLASACRSPPEVDCGTCTSPEVCNPNGRCGPPCAPSTCVSPEFVGKCGTSIDAGCEVTVDCGCGNGLLCSASQPTVVGACAPPAACAAFGASGDAGNPCSNDPSPVFPSGGGTNLACSCTGSGVCVDSAKNVVGQGDAGTCCANAAVCAPNSCGTSVVDTCTGKAIPCTCGTAGTFCLADAGVCVPTRTCASYGANGDAGNPCSNGPSPSFPRNATENLACLCGVGGRCNVPDGGIALATPGEVGACCFNTQTCAANECGTTKTNTCTGGLVTCSCAGVPNSHCDTGTHTCKSNLTCLDYGANGATGSVCSNGGAFSNGDIPPALLTCPCTGANVCSSGSTVVSGSTTGNCCLNTATCGNRCHVSSTNTCTGVVTACECNPLTAYCSAPAGVEGVCISYNTCSTYGASGNQNNICSTSANPAFNQMPDGGGSNLTCDCTGGRACSVDAGVPNPHRADAGELGRCCTNTASCGSGASRICNTSVLNTCTSATITCAGCDTNYYCSSTTGPGVCIAYNTCSTYNANGAQGNVCSTSANAAFSQLPDGGGSLLTCNCTNPLLCSVDAGVTNPHLATTGELGKCCTNAASCPTNTCVTLKNTCTGANIPCGCSTNYHCSGGGAPGSTCVADLSCSSYGANGAPTNPCSTVPTSAFHDGPSGTNLTCPCSTGSGYANNVCVGSSSTVAGTCSCTPSTPANCSDDGKPNGCGLSMVSKCGSGQVCYNAACCTTPVCPAGNTGDVCGLISACGQTVNCGCVLNHSNTSCGAKTPGVCDCKPYDTTNCGGNPLPAGYPPDGCGGTVDCSHY